MKQAIRYVIMTAIVSFSMVACSNQQDFDSGKVNKGEFIQTITETGELKAVNMRGFTMPRYGRYWYSMKIIGLIEHGTKVEPGDSLVQFDPSEVNKLILEFETKLESERAILSKLIVEQNNKLTELNSELRTEEASFALKKLEMERMKFGSENTKKIKSLEYRKAEISLEMAKRKIELNKIFAKNELKIQKIKVKQTEKDLETGYEVLPALTIRTPISGIFQIANKHRSKEFLKIGDEVNSGHHIGNVPDLTWMKVSTTVNETDISKIFVGQKVLVRLDANPDVTFDSEVSYVGKLCREFDKNDLRKVFDVEVKLLVSDERLKPGMTVSCEFIATNIDDAFYVSNEHLFIDDNGRNFIKVKGAVASEKIYVNIVARNNTHTAIEGAGIEKGMALAD